MENHITYYDQSSIVFSGLFVNGLQSNAKRLGYVFSIEKILPEFMEEYEAGFPIREFLTAISLFKVTANGEVFFFCIDATDFTEIGGMHHAKIQILLDNVKYYFKVNCNLNSNETARFNNKIIALPIVYPEALAKLWKFFPQVSALFKGDLGGFVDRLKQVKSTFSVPSIKHLRNFAKEKEFDVFFVVAYYEHSDHAADNEFRYKLISEIRKLEGVKAIAGFASRKKLPEKYAEFQLPRYSLSEYLNFQSKARVAIYIRGLHKCLSFKLGHLLGIGLPIVGQSLLNNTQIYNNIDSYSEQFAFESTEEIIGGLIALLGHPEKQHAFAESNAKFFDQYLSADKVAETIIETVLE
jgi:hypothetical protein